jgi:hypothetical protein
MKIGLAGIPGSGKTKLAKAIQFALSDKYNSIEIIDDYVSSIEKQTDLALSFTAAYVGNIHVALGRAALERIAHENNDFTITCGTLFETSSYAVQSFEKDYANVTNEAQKHDFAQRSEATMRIFACFYVDLIKYDHIFYLTPVNVSDDEEIGQLDKNLQAAFKAFDLFDYTLLENEGSTNEKIVNNRLEKVLKVINANNSEKQGVQT